MLLEILKMKKKKTEKKIEYTEFKVAQDGLTVAVNKDNDFVDELSMDELAKFIAAKQNVERC